MFGSLQRLRSFSFSLTIRIDLVLFFPSTSHYYPYCSRMLLCCLIQTLASKTFKEGCLGNLFSLILLPRLIPGHPILRLWLYYISHGSSSSPLLFHALATHAGSATITWMLFIIWLPHLFIYSIELHVFLSIPPALPPAQYDYTESSFTGLELRWADYQTLQWIAEALIERTLPALSQRGAASVVISHFDPVHLY